MAHVVNEQNFLDARGFGELVEGDEELAPLFIFGQAERVQYGREAVEHEHEHARAYFPQPVGLKVTYIGVENVETGHLAAYTAHGAPVGAGDALVA